MAEQPVVAERKQVAFLGTGIMGVQMARRLAEAGHAVTAWNRTRDKAEPLAGHGARVTATAAEAASGADIVILMVSDGPTSDAVLFGREGGDPAVAGGLHPGATVVVMSSIPVETARAQAERLAASGVAYVDAPVSGGEVGAREGTLTIMAGGDPGAVEAVRPVLEIMGRVTRVGPAGAGSLCKLVNQIIVANTIGAVAEAFLLAKAGGADLPAVRDALSGGFADSRILRLHGQRMAEGQFKAGGPARLQLKDVRTATKLARSLELELPVTELVEQLFADMVEHGDGELDHSGLYREIARRNRLL